MSQVLFPSPTAGASPQLAAAPAPADAHALRWWMYLLLFLAAVAVYGNSLKNGFALDDVGIVQVNDHVTGLHWAEIWSDNYWPKQDGVAPDVLYRPLTVWTYLANEALAPGVAWTFHLTNVLLHGLASVLVAALAWRIFGRRSVAFAAGLLFALHPLHTEAVANTVGRAEILAAVWSLLMLLVYLPSTPLVGGGRLERRRWPHGLLVAACFFAAMLCKETPVTLLVALPFIDLWRWVNADKADRPALLRWFARQSFRYYSWLFAAFALYMGMRVHACGLMAETSHIHPIVNPLAAATLPQRIVTPFALFAKYFQLTAWPAVLSADYSAPSLMPLSNPFAPMPLLGICLALGLTFLGIKTWRRRPAVALALGLFVCSYGLVANVLRIGTIFGERLFYWPSVFVLITFAYALFEGYQALARRGLLRTARVGLVALGVSATSLMTWRTTVRNTDWESNIALSIATARDNLQSAKACYWAGTTLVTQGPQPWMQEFGAKMLERGIDLYPEYAECYWELAKFHGRKGEFINSVELLAKAAMYHPGCNYIRGGVEAVRADMAARKPESYLPQLQAYVKEHPDEASGIFALALGYDSSGQLELAEKTCQQAFDQDHTFHEAAYEMARVRHARGEYAAAVDMLRQYVMNVPFSPDVRCLMASYLLDLDETRFPHALAEAQMNLDRAAAINPLPAIRELRMKVARRLAGESTDHNAASPHPSADLVAAGGNAS